MNKNTSVEIAFLGTLIGALAFTNFALYTFREGVTLTVGTENTLNYARATTLTYLTIAYCQFANILSRRHEYFSIFNRNFWTNKILLSSILTSIGLVFLGVYGPYISDFLNFSPITVTDWLFVLGAAVIFLGVFEALKFFKRIRRTRSSNEYEASVTESLRERTADVVDGAEKVLRKKPEEQPPKEKAPEGKPSRRKRPSAKRE